MNAHVTTCSISLWEHLQRYEDEIRSCPLALVGEVADWASLEGHSACAVDRAIARIPDGMLMGTALMLWRRHWKTLLRTEQPCVGTACNCQVVNGCLHCDELMAAR